jgi:hypothetical protein
MALPFMGGGSPSADDSESFSLFSMAHNKQFAIGRVTHSEETALAPRFVGAFKCRCERVVKHTDRFVEGDLVLLTVGRRLFGVPLEPHYSIPFLSVLVRIRILEHIATDSGNVF